MLNFLRSKYIVFVEARYKHVKSTNSELPWSGALRLE